MSGGFQNSLPEKDIAQEAEMYAVVDKGEPTENRSKDEAETSGENECHMQSGREMYAAVDKRIPKQNATKAAVLDRDNTNKTGEESKLRTNMVTAKKGKEKNKGRNGSLKENNKLSAGSRRTNDEGLIYIDVDFTNKPESSNTNQKHVIHGEEDRTEYTFVDFSKKAPPTPETNDKEGNYILKMLGFTVFMNKAVVLNKVICLHMSPKQKKYPKGDFFCLVPRAGKCP
uniref:Uncharacterized protein n=1 Tax=Magallana gigas TaxID=29159 RepID=K1QER3_MAGGI